jgi:molybdate transport system ATP-binding protein
MSQDDPRAGLQARFKGKLGAFRLDVAFALAPSGVTALVGPSGSGKSSVLRCIAGLTRLNGAVSLDGQVWQDARSFTPAYRRPVGFVFQDAALLSHLSVKGNLLYAQKRARSPATIAWSDVIAWLGLEPLLPRSTANLSGGERQRVAIGRALLTQPKILLMDEPLSSLDTASKAEILPYLENLHRTLALPILYVSHDPGEVARLADHVLTMHEGRIAPTPAAPSAEQRLAGLIEADRDALALAALVAGLKPQPLPPEHRITSKD